MFLLYILEFEQMQEKLVEMTLDGEEKKQEQSGASASSGSIPFPLVGGGPAVADDDSDSDSGPVGDIDDFEMEEDDPVSVNF